MAAPADDLPSLDPDASLDQLPGIGARLAARLGEQGLSCVRDLLRLFPRRCRGLVELHAPDEAYVGQLVRLLGTVRGTRLAFLPGRRAMVTVEFVAGDGTPFTAAFFNQPWLKNSYAPGEERSVEGSLDRKGRRWSLKAARVLPRTSAPQGEVQLAYPDLEGVSSARLQAWIGAALDRVDWRRLQLPPLPAALEQHDLTVQELHLAMHRPPDVGAHERAREHFALREAVALFERVEAARRRRQGRSASRFPVDAGLADRIRARLPFSPTADQEQAILELRRRLLGPAPMGVLLQGDVGTGKTAVAVATALAVVAGGGQVAFLAPTELLAEQHFATVGGWLRGSEVAVDLLTASRAPAERRGVVQRLAAGRAGLVFGTHALFSGDAVFGRLELVIVDEQHRFGVEQRMALIGKGRDPHVLVMTATPIPRTLTLVRFGDLDVVTLRARPPGRRPVPARYCADWPRVVRSIGRAVRRGGGVYVVCPEIGDEDSRVGATRVHEALRRRFAAGLVHGRMTADQRQQAIEAFRDGRCQVLVGTTVVEVGVDVSRAVLMVVVAADRFGLATLHQLRGRVGRQRRRGVCIVTGPRTPRTDALCATTCGFELAEADLRLRGSGELLGTRQSGFAGFRALDPVEDQALLLRARQAVSAAAEAVAPAPACPADPVADPAADPAQQAG